MNFIAWASNEINMSYNGKPHVQLFHLFVLLEPSLEVTELSVSTALYLVKRDEIIPKSET